MTEDEAMRRLLGDRGEHVYVVANGYLSRRVFAHRLTNPVFYMIGSMGLALSIGLGVAIARKGRRIVVIDGDGNLLMGLASLSMVGHIAPTNLLHVVIDNGQYASTGGQLTISASTDFGTCAVAAGYRFASDVNDASSLDQALTQAREASGPALIRVRVVTSGSVGPRVSCSPEAITSGFMQALQTPYLNQNRYSTTVF
jgi:phosphonopyruvate decarboxylase